METFPTLRWGLGEDNIDPYANAAVGVHGTSLKKRWALACDILRAI